MIWWENNGTGSTTHWSDHEEEKVVVDGTLSTDKGGDFVSQTEVEMDHEASQIAARYFELAMFMLYQGTIAKSTDSRGHYPIQADFAENPKTVTTARVAACEEAAFGQHQRGATSTEQNKKFDPWGRTVNCLFLPSGDAIFCMLWYEFYVLPACNFLCYHTRY